MPSLLPAEPILYDQQDTDMLYVVAIMDFEGGRWMQKKASFPYRASIPVLVGESDVC